MKNTQGHALCPAHVIEEGAKSSEIKGYTLLLSMAIEILEN